jgi:hypothetical protein
MPDNVYRTVSQPQSGYILNPARGYLSVIAPEATENIIANPSFEFINTLPWYVFNTGGTVSATLVADWQTSGAKSLKVTTGGATVVAGVELDIDVIPATRYTLGMDVKCVLGNRYNLRVEGTGTILANLPFIGTGFLRYLTVGFDTGLETHVHLFVEQVGTGSPFYIDTVQCEAKAYATTHCDGDQRGCVWSGKPHASRSSRSADEASGGRVRRLDQYGLHVLSISGLEMPTVTHQSVDYATRHGSVYQNYRFPTRQITIVGIISGPRPDVFQSRKRELIKLFNVEQMPTPQPITFRYQAYDGKRKIGNELEFSAVYAEGLEGAGDNVLQERVAIRFTLYDPLLREVTTSGSAVDFQDTFCAIPPLAARINGQWNSLGCPSTFANVQVVNVTKIGPDGKLYIGGYFRNFNGEAGLDFIARYNFETALWEEIGTLGDVNGRVMDLTWDSSGNLYLVGFFTSIAGDATRKYIAKWNETTTTWSTLGTPSSALPGAFLRTITIDTGGNIWVGGQSIQNFAGIANANGIAKWNISTSLWEAVGNIQTDVYDIIISPTGEIYASGEITSPFSRVGKYVSGTTWVQIGDVTNYSVECMAFSQDGKLYIGGAFLVASSAYLETVAVYNGDFFEAVGNTEYKLGGVFYFPAITIRVHSIAIANNGDIYVSYGDTNAISTFVSSFPCGAIKWNGFSWVALDLSVENANARVDVNAASIYLDVSDNIYIGFQFELFAKSNSVNSAGITTIQNNGTTINDITFSFKGPGTLYTLANETTGDRIWFDVVLQTGEMAVLNLGSNLSFQSTFVAGSFSGGGGGATGPRMGSLISKIKPGSAISTFRLVPGENKISCLIDGVTSGVTSVTMHYKPTYLGVSGASGVSK